MNRILIISLSLFCSLLLTSYYANISQEDSITQDASEKVLDDNTEKLVYVIEVRDNIDPRMNRKIDLAMKKAEERKADFVILDMDTYGGALNDADEIRSLMLEFPKPVFSFINKDAASAGALISIACDSIYMAPGSSIGAATVVTGDGQAAPDKYQSYMRSIMRATAEARGRDPKIAEGMVDERIEIEGITKAGEVITFSTSEAIKYNFCEAEVRNIDQIMERIGVKEYRIEKYRSNTTEKIISVFLNPFISGILILVIIGGLYFELQTPGVGFPLIASLIALTLYFIPYYLNGLADYWEVAVFFLGIALIAVEVFVLPGFGVAGIAGILCVFGSLILMMLGNDGLSFEFVPTEKIVSSIVATFGAFLASLLLFIFGGVRFSNSNAFKRFALQDVFTKEQGYTSNFNKTDMIGKIGTAYTILRPSGKVMIEDELYDAFTRGNYVERNQKIIVVGDEGTSLKVKEYNEEV